MDNAILAYHIHPMSKQLGDEFVIPTNSFLWTTCRNTIDIYYPEEQTISHWANTFMASTFCPMNSKYQN